ncbi:MAG: hypothetical protein ABF465_10705, partial [Acetobacter orientalis]|uniref:hypothetical protein n=1 Tax=Acetobacter orientalis TaxID=146474 RepID=UPI0039E82646
QLGYYSIFIFTYKKARSDKNALHVYEKNRSCSVNFEHSLFTRKNRAYMSQTFITQNIMEPENE